MIAVRVGVEEGGKLLGNVLRLTLSKLAFQQRDGLTDEIRVKPPLFHQMLHQHAALFLVDFSAYSSNS